MKTCQSGRDPNETGFLLDGQLPEENVDNFLKTLRIIGGTTKKQKPANEDQGSIKSEGTISDSIDEIINYTAQRKKQDDDCTSETSFGQTSMISSSNQPALGFTSQSKVETKTRKKAEPIDISKGWKTASQEEIDDLFNQV